MRRRARQPSPVGEDLRDDFATVGGYAIDAEGRELLRSAWLVDRPGDDRAGHLMQRADGRRGQRSVSDGHAVGINVSSREITDLIGSVDGVPRAKTCLAEADEVTWTAATDDVRCRILDHVDQHPGEPGTNDLLTILRVENDDRSSRQYFQDGLDRSVKRRSLFDAELGVVSFKPTARPDDFLEVRQHDPTTVETNVQFCMSDQRTYQRSRNFGGVDLVSDNEHPSSVPYQVGREPMNVRRRTVITAVVTLGTVIVLAAECFLLRHDLGLAGRAVRRAELWWVFAGVGLEVISMGCFARQQRGLALAAGGARSSLSMRRMTALVFSSNALSATLPAGGAVALAFSIRRLRSWGLTSAAAVFTLTGSGIVSFVTLGVLGCLYGSLFVTWWGSALAIAGVATGVTVMLIARRTSGRGVSQPLRRPATADCPNSRWRAAALRNIGRLTSQARAITPRRSDWAAAAFASLGNWAADFGCLYAACVSVGLPSSVLGLSLLGAYLAGMTTSSVAFLPGGFGVVEVAMSAALHGDGVPLALATAAVLVYRAVSVVIVVALGWVTLGLLNRVAVRRTGHSRADEVSMPGDGLAG